MTEEAQTALARRLLGLLLLGLAAAALVVFALGFWNPWRLVWLSHYFGSPPVGLAVVMGLCCLGSWLAFPVRNEATDNARIMFRFFTAAGAVIGLAVWGVVGPVFVTKITIVATTPDGERTVALVERSDRSQALHVWQGGGLRARDMGTIGRACGEPDISFVTRDRIQINSSYGDWQIDLDPTTGRPQQALGPHCGDGPRPATLER